MGAAPAAELPVDVVKQGLQDVSAASRSGSPPTGIVEAAQPFGRLKSTVSRPGSMIRAKRSASAPILCLASRVRREPSRPRPSNSQHCVVLSSARVGASSCQERSPSKPSLAHRGLPPVLLSVDSPG